MIHCSLKNPGAFRPLSVLSIGKALILLYYLQIHLYSSRPSLPGNTKLSWTILLNWCLPVGASPPRKCELRFGIALHIRAGTKPGSYQVLVQSFHILEGEAETPGGSVASPGPEVHQGQYQVSSLLIQCSLPYTSNFLSFQLNMYQKFLMFLCLIMSTYSLKTITRLPIILI